MYYWTLLPPRIATFEKVPYEQFRSDMIKLQDRHVLKFGDTIKDMERVIQSCYDAIRLPVRSTSGSGGYDFFIPFDYKLYPGRSIVIPTGVRAKIDPGWCLLLLPRSSLGFSYRVQLDNTVGLIDSDYYGNDKNSGHIFAKITNDSKEELPVEFCRSERFLQGIFLPYGITQDDHADGVRTGGIGSTGA